MKIRILAVGKLKEAYFKEAEKEYLKRLSSFADTSVTELADFPSSKTDTDAERDIVKEKEGKEILKNVKSSQYLVLLSLNGKMEDSVSFSNHLSKMLERSGANLTFVIGGSLGVSEEVKKRANEKIKLSPMTFPHQLARIILLEQLYRAFKIAHNEPYHK